MIALLTNTIHHPKRTMSPPLAADGSSPLDAQRVTVDRSDEIDRMRYRCPNGHINWDRTNSHIWCQSCSRASEHDDSVDPEHWEIIDERTGETIPWSAVRVVGDG